jgi:hypothetical protein
MSRKVLFPRARVGTFFVPLGGVLKVNSEGDYRRVPTLTNQRLHKDGDSSSIAALLRLYPPR